MIAATPRQGGAAWAVLQYVLGLRRLGAEVHFVEPIDGAEVRPESARYCQAVMERFGLEDRWALLPGEGGEPIGMPRERIREAARGAEVILNVSGMLADPEVLGRIPVRVYLDLDPAFAQLWAAEGIDIGLDAHTHFVTLADTIGAPGSPIPTCGREWLPTLPPVVLDEWPVADRLERRALTTVGHWRSYGSIAHDGVHYGQKVHSLRPLIELPRRSPIAFELAISIHPDEAADIGALDASGWGIVDPGPLRATPDDYRRFVQGSWAEFGLAKSGYVVSGCGWFSDRSACYLASGRPVVAQATGFDRRLPTGLGLFAFSTVDEAVAAIEDLAADYERHRSAAREVAAAHLDSDRVLSSLLERIGG